jgi:hypothetical protein
MNTYDDDLLLDAIVRADAAYIADLVVSGRSAEADEYAQKPDVSARIRRWKALQ